MEEYKRFTYFTAILENLSFVIGTEVYKVDYKPSFRTQCTCIAVVALFMSSIYAIFFYSGDIFFIIRVLVILPFGFQGYIKLQTFIVFRPEMFSLLTFLRKIYVLNTFSPPNRKEVIKKHLDRLFFYFNIGKFIFPIAVLYLVVFTVFSLLYFKKKELIFAFIFPGTNPETNIGYVVNIILQLIIVIIGFCGNLSSDLSFALLILHVPLLERLFASSLDDIEKDLLTTSRNQDFNFVRIKLRNCLQMHQDIINYINVVQRTFMYNICGQIILSVAPFTLILFSVFVTTWPAAYGLLLFFFLQFFLYCMLGTILEITIDDIVTTIYNFKWYLTPIDCQRCILFALIKSQNTQPLTIMGIVPLNMQTGAKVIKTIYSYFMMLLTLLK